MTTPDNDPFATIAPYYDLEFATIDVDIDLYLGYAERVGSPILELGCGTGRLLDPLAEAGYDVTGLDSSPAMLDRARARLNDAGLDSVCLVEGDMRDLTRFPQHQFRLVIVAINSFMHLLSHDDQLTALQSIARVLDDDGIVIIDLFHPTPGMLSRLDDRLSLQGPWYLPDGSRVDRWSRYQLHPAEQVVETTFLYDVTDRNGRVSRANVSFPTRYLHRFELESLLVEAGLELEGIYGSYELDSLDDGSDIMLVVAHRRPERGRLPRQPLL